MKNINENLNLEQEIQNLRTENEKLKNKNTELELLIKHYEELIRLAKHKQFGSSSEKTEHVEQLGLFDEAESTADKKEPEPTIEEITYKRKKRVGKREEDLSALPVEKITYELPESEKSCPECNHALHEMTKEIRRELKIIPAQVKVVEHVKHVYACRDCAKKNDHVPIIKATTPEPVIKGSLASPSSIAHIMVEKYVKAVPLYRQEQSFIRDGIPISRQTMANWIIRSAEDWLVHVYNRLKELLLKEQVLHADETVLQVLRELGKKANTNSYEWLYRTSGCAKHAIILYEYQPTRSSSHPKRFLSGWGGYLHTDGYQGYNDLPGVTVIGCLAHVRRKFDEALKIMPTDQRASSAAAKGQDYCNKLFALEREFQELPPEQRYEKRLEKSFPIAEAFLAWAKTFEGTAKTPTKAAADYFVNQWGHLKNFYADGRLEISNNRAERSIKPFVIGRKNWLFSNTTKGAQASSVIYSIIQTAIENGLRPFDYLVLLFETLPNCPLSKIDDLMPWNAEVQDICKAKI
ncbi:MAG: IS66 family transposase [Fibromonadaceae bacterium]|jgi:transposase|nr:IS66 family transposase [Fibromonadaceae bacterium]